MKSKKEPYQQVTPQELWPFKAQMVQLTAPILSPHSIASNVNDSLEDESEKPDEKMF